MRTMKANPNAVKGMNTKASEPADFSEKELAAERDRYPVEIAFDHLSERLDRLQSLIRQLDARIQPVSCDQATVQGEALNSVCLGSSTVVRSLQHHAEHVDNMCTEVSIMLEGLEL